MRDAIETQDRPISNNFLGLNRGRSEDSDDIMDTEIDRKTHQMFDRLEFGSVAGLHHGATGKVDAVTPVRR